jgi:hypothetical protein
LLRFLDFEKLLLLPRITGRCDFPPIAPYVRIKWCWIYLLLLPNVFGTPGRLARFSRVREPLLPLPDFDGAVAFTPSRTAFKNA